MGCCNSSTKYSPEELNQRLLECFDSDSPKRLEYYISLKYRDHKKEDFNIDTFTLKTSLGQELNLLGLSMLYGKLEFIKLIHELHKGSFVEMEKCLNKFGYSGLRLICENNYLEVFEYYSGVYIGCKESIANEYCSRVKDLCVLGKDPSSLKFLQKNPECKFSPIHYACVYGNISIIKAISSFASTLTEVPLEFDTNYIEEGQGYNCALIACKRGNYNMIKFLNNACKADFTLLTKNKESCLQVLFSGATDAPMTELYNCLVYLVEKVKVDIRHNYEEVLTQCEIFKVTDYYIQKLIESGIDLKKSELEEKCKKTKIARFGSFTESKFTDLVFK